MTPAPSLSAFHFDVRRVLQPIAPDAPAGQSLRYEGIYDRIRLWRQEDDPVLQQGVWKTTLKKADWPSVEKACIEALETQSKDVQIAAWLVEAWVHLYGFAGLREGFRLMAAVCENFWDELYPQVEDGDAEFRISPFIWLNDRLPTFLKLIPVTAPQSDDVKAYCWADWETACRPRNHAESDKDNSRVTQARFQQSAMLTSTLFLRSTVHQIRAALQEAAGLEAVLNRRCGADSPSLRQFTIILDPLRGLLEGILSQRPEEEDGQPMENDPMSQTEEPAAEEGAASTFHVGPIRSRSEAYLRLEEAAEYLARTEPHSPTPYLIKRAIAWGGMRLEDLLPELVRNRGELDGIFDLLHISKGAG
jgi:type VI secretion system protein ImpA